MGNFSSVPENNSPKKEQLVDNYSSESPVPPDTPIDTIGWDNYSEDSVDKQIIDLDINQPYTEDKDFQVSTESIQYIMNDLKGGALDDISDDDTIDLDDIDTPESDNLNVSTSHSSEENNELKEYDFSTDTENDIENDLENNLENDIENDIEEEERITSSSVNTEDLDFIFERNH